MPNKKDQTQQDLTAKEFIKRLEALRSPQAANSHGHLASDKQDKIMGVRMGQIFALAKEFMDTPLKEVEKLLDNPFHEARVGAVSIMDFQARGKRTSEERKKELFDLYIRKHDRINTWDLVDRSGIWVVGGYLFDKHARFYTSWRNPNSCLKGAPPLWPLFISLERKTWMMLSSWLN